MAKINRIIFTSLFLISFIYPEQAPIVTELPKTTAAELVQNAIKKSFSQGYHIDRTPIESSLYLQRIITSYNAHVKHSISTLLKKEIDQKFSHAKELSYLLEQLNGTKTIKQAIVMLTRAVSAHKVMRQENATHPKKIEWYENAYSPISLQSSAILLNAAREQFLIILDELNNSLLYWREQKNHPVKYFLYKSPLKWVMGKRQADEIVGNIKKLEKMEHDVRVLLGRVTKHIYAFKPDGNVDECYTWINQLLSMLYCVGVDSKKVEYENRFDETADKIRFKLGHVGSLKNILLSKISATIKPGHVARNWLKYTAAFAAVFAARNYYMKNTEAVNQIIGPEALAGYATQVQSYTYANAIKPVLDTAKAIFVGRTNFEDQQDIEVTRLELKKVLDKLLETQPVGWIGWALGAKEGIVDEKTLTRETADYILAQEIKGNLIPLKQLLFDLNKGVVALTVGESANPVIQTALLYIDFMKYHGSEPLRVTWNLAIVTPTMVMAGLGLYGLNKLYQSATARDYTAIRFAMLNINSLFIESIAPLSDHDYGKLLYLLQDLKTEAMRYLTQADMRGDFLTDLAKLESHNFTVETKRKMIKNMFMKYPFLSLNAKSA